MKSGTAALFVLLTAVPVLAADLCGDWQLAAQVLNDVTYARVTLKIEGEKLTGTLNEIRLDGTVKGDVIAFTATRPVPAGEDRTHKGHSVN